MASTNAFMAVDIPASRIATLNVMPPMCNKDKITNMIQGDKTNLTNDTNSESPMLRPMALKSMVKPNDSIIRGMVESAK